MKKMPRLWLAGMLFVGLIIGLVLGGIFFSRTEYVPQNSNCQAGCYATEASRNYAVLTNYQTVNKPWVKLPYPNTMRVSLYSQDCGSGCFITSAYVVDIGNGNYQEQESCACWTIS